MLTELNMSHTKPAVVAMSLERSNFYFYHFFLSILLDHVKLPPAIIIHVFRMDNCNIIFNIIIEKS